MKAFLIILSAALLAGSVFAADDNAELKDKKEKISYSLGVDIATAVKRQGYDVDPDILSAAFKDVWAGKKLKMTEEEIGETLTEAREEAMEKQREMALQKAEKNKIDGIAFLEENKKKEGVTQTLSGLQYKVIKAGNGKKPGATDTVSVHYKGTLIDGTEFDSSYKRGEPAKFPVNRVIKGWTEALQLMPVGSKWMLYIPSDLAYGERGAGRGAIAPHSTLIFEVELLGIEE